LVLWQSNGDTYGETKMLKQVIIAIISLGFLGGCLTFSHDFKQFDGRKLSDLIERSGVPDKQRNIAGYTVYTWESWRAIDGTSYQCTFEATTKTGSGTIIKSDVNGNIGGCNSLGRRMGL
jgi:hypothetical protein